MRLLCPDSLMTQPPGARLPRRIARPPSLLERLRQRLDHCLPGGFVRAVEFFAERAAGHRPLVRMQQPGLEQALADDGHAAGLVHFRGSVGAPGSEVRQHRGLLRDAVEVLDRQLDAELIGGRQQVQHGIGGATGGHDAGDRVLETAPRDQAARGDAGAHEVHHEPAAFEGDIALGGTGRGDVVPAQWRDPEHLVGGRHRVGGELAPASAGPWAGVVLDVLELRCRDPSGIEGADRLVDVLDRQPALAEHRCLAVATARFDRAAEERHAGDVEPTEHHRHRRDRLVAAREGDDAVEQVAAGHQLDRVRDQLTADERCLHALGSRGDAVVDRHGVDFDRRAAGGTDACHHPLSELAVIQVAGHRADPAMGDADLRTGKIIIGEARRLHHRARNGAVGAVEQGAALVSRVGCDDPLQSSGCYVFRLSVVAM